MSNTDSKHTVRIRERIARLTENGRLDRATQLTAELILRRKARKVEGKIRKFKGRDGSEVDRALASIVLRRLALDASDFYAGLAFLRGKKNNHGVPGSCLTIQQITGFPASLTGLGLSHEESVVG